MSKVVFSNVPRRTKPNRTVQSPTATANPGVLTSDSVTYQSDHLTTHTWRRPSNVVAGDHIYTAINLHRANGGGLPSITSTPAGAILIDSYSTAGAGVADVHFYVYYEVATGTETDVSFTVDPSARASLVAWRVASNGVTLGVPEFAEADWTDPDPITPTVPGLYAVSGVFHATKGGPGTAATDYTTVNQVVNADGWASELRPRTYVMQRSVQITTNEDPGAIGWPDTTGNRIYRMWTVATRLDTASPALATGDHVHTHDTLTDRNLDANHLQYSLIDGTRAFTGEVAGVTPTTDPALATKGYVDSVAGATDHGALTGLADVADHAYASLIDGSRAFTGTVAGVTPTVDAHLATKGYVDSAGGGGSGEILISDAPSTPLVFADLLQNEAQDDLIYQD